jgi:3-oxoadipate enol-lactonase
VLLVHAGVADGRMWMPLADRLTAAGYRVIVPDLQGFGRTPLAPGTVSHPADLVALLDELGVERATVAGASFGGFVALALALRAPERVAGLVLMGAALDEFEPSHDLATFDASEETALEAGDLDAAVELNVRFWVDRPGRRDPADVDPAVRDLVATMQRNAFEAQIGIDAKLEQLDPPVARRLHEIAAPALVLAGADDAGDFVAIAQRLAEELPGASEVVTVARAAHLPALERPDEVADLVLAFLATPAPAGR